GGVQSRLAVARDRNVWAQFLHRAADQSLWYRARHSGGAGAYRPVGGCGAAWNRTCPLLADSHIAWRGLELWFCRRIGLSAGMPSSRGTDPRAVAQRFHRVRYDGIRLVRLGGVVGGV